MASSQVDEVSSLSLSSFFNFFSFKKTTDDYESDSECGETTGDHGLPGVIRQSDLDEMLADDKPIELWEPEKWKLIKTLAAAASGDGTVELMSSEAGERVAVKRLPWDIIRSSSKDFTKQFPKAAERPWTDMAIVKHLNSINFPYTCKCLGVFLGNNEVNTVTSFATHGDIFSWVQHDQSEVGEARETAIRPIVSQIFKGVCWLHDLGIAHRDLSAENVMLTDDGSDELQVKIIDFGMATLSRKVKREVRGKRSYQAPEMHGTVKYDTFLADNFALGVIVYCMGVHYYPWEHTKPGKDRSCEFARAHGLEKFMHKKRLPRSDLSVAEAFSESYCDLVCGLLDFDTQTRHSVGEACFHPVACKSKSSWMKGDEGDALSQMSTACSTLDSLPPMTQEGCGTLDSLPPMTQEGCGTLDSLPPMPEQACFTLDSLPPMPQEGCGTLDSLPEMPQEESNEHADVPTAQPMPSLPSRIAVWDCRWLL